MFTVICIFTIALLLTPLPLKDSVFAKIRFNFLSVHVTYTIEM